jgi:cell division transport system permease protein
LALSYTIREGLAGFSRAKFAAATAITALTIALVLIAVFGLLAWQGQRVSQALEQQVGEVEVFLVRADEPSAREVRILLDSDDAVSSHQYVSVAEAQARFREEFGDEAEQFMDGAFLQASYRVRLRQGYTSPDSVEAAADRIRGHRRVEDVVYNTTLLARVQENLRAVQYAGLGLGMLVVLAALLLVGNTVRLTIYARRMLIRTMKLVGATDGFIRRPFLVEGISQGVIAGVIGAALVYGLYRLLVFQLPALEGQAWPLGHPLPTLAAVVLFGTLLGWFASAIAVRRFLKGVRLN